MPKKHYRVSADIGGTFTDLVFYNMETGKYTAGKTLTTPANLSDAVMNGIGESIENFEDIEFFVHGTTSGLNAFLERRGAKVALIMTQGFRNVYEIARGNRPPMFDFRYHKPTPLVQPCSCYEVEERLLTDGTEYRPVNPASVKAAADEIAKGDFTSVAVCLINAYENPAHELEIEKLLHEYLPGVPVSLSHRVAHEWREYERTSSTVINAYIAPIVQKYLEFLEERMAGRNFGKNVHIMQSGGGVITADMAKRIPIQTLMSGPVGGAVGNQTLSQMLGIPNLIGVDMGGTSYDVSMVVDGRADVSNEVNLEGFPILTPMVNIHTIGAGGGSIAWIEAGGLRVGPKSAGSVPGPACYGRGGKDPTITDANVVLGHLDPHGFLGGNMDLDKEASIEAMKTVAGPLNMTVEELAQGICEIADAKMADAIRQLTVRKGIDPREFVLVAFGGAGPMHACTTAEELEITKVLVPELPGTFSAWGMLQSDIRQDLARTYQHSLMKVDVTDVAAKYDEMTAEAMELLIRQDITEDQAQFVRNIDIRYVGQEYTVRISFPEGPVNQEALDAVIADFHNQHLQIYGFNNPGGEVECVNLRLVGLGVLEKMPKQKSDIFCTDAPIPEKSQEAIFKNIRYEAKIYQRDTLKPGQEFMGPAIVEELTTTTVIPPFWKVTIDPFYNMMITKEEGGEQ
ncbi:MAG: hydantoinase/oxoprolinase family protein [Lachnospiraceae bacterium]|nr:hydantoinase/oxoprolinase family protein [Lachnospiraceae bacterium]